jgi:hypothetical protein
MAEITISIGDVWVPRILDAFDGLYPGRVTLDEEGNPVELYTKVQWAKKKVARHVKLVLQRWEASQAAEDARQASIEDTEGADVS